MAESNTPPASSAEPKQDQGIAAAAAVPSGQAAAADAPVSADELRVRVWSPFKVYYDGPAKSISGINGTGPFDILPKHHNFITLLDACDLGLVTAEGKIKVRITGGVMHVHKNQVVVFLEV